MEALKSPLLKTDLQIVQDYLDAAFDVDGDLMGEVAQFVKSTRGKMMRPALVCLSARLFGYNEPKRHDAILGASLELFHMATLLHDDVIDKAPVRRGRPTVNAKWGDDVAILFADYLYATSFDYALEVLSPEVVRVLSKTTQKMTEGEMFQIEKRGQWLQVEDYFSIIRAKTAYLFSAASGLGGIIAGADPESVQKLFNYGLNFGMAFQLTDDTLDYEAQGDAWGKRVGADLAEGKQTLPLLHALQQATEEERASMIELLNEGRDFETIHAFVKAHDGIEFSLERAQESTKTSLDILNSFEDSESLSLLKEITDSLVVRQF